MILITGGCGYIGTALSEILTRRGEEFRVLDNLSGCNPLNLIFLNHAEFVWGDVRKREDIREALEGVEVIIHLAAKLPTAPGIIDDAKNDVEDVNYTGTLNVLEEARRKDLKVLFASTCNVYGVGTNLDENSIVHPLNPYSKSKLKAEELCIEYSENYGLDVVILRLASVYGYSPGVRFNLVVNYFTLRALLGYNLTVFGLGDNWRPFIHVRDAAESFLFLMDRGKSGEIYNVGGENYRIRDVAEVVRDTVNPSARIEYMKDRTPEFSYSVDFSKIQELGFCPESDLRAGIKDLASRLEALKSLRR
ncbi:MULTISPECIES: NAD-dependent epimerase/dehydratase family protein [unclassified Archaeoglobus]|jgi:nucleoside-diphosphate-sugar epimerase|uniref:NAD-dependent epimerase/dehydratase family protein n=1 Tax=unclassified Archaeoglobus TaxID=2643606 RepID=UPI0025BDBF92|nr:MULTISPECIES: NAD-dependent epimerase/dehydratase family protein [unclassified Archaeoglobus]